MITTSASARPSRWTDQRAGGEEGVRGGSSRTGSEGVKLPGEPSPTISALRALRTPATPSWLILTPFARTASAIALSGLPCGPQAPPFRGSPPARPRAGRARRSRRAGSRTEPCRRDSGRAPSGRPSPGRRARGSGRARPRRRRRRSSGTASIRPLPEMSPPRSSRCRRDAALAQVLDHRERVEGRAEQAVELRRDDDVALRRAWRTARRPSAARRRARSRETPSSTTTLVERQPVHVGVALDLPVLDVEAFALVRLPQRRNPAISVSRHVALCQFVSVRMHHAWRRRRLSICYSTLTRGAS